MTEAMEIIRRTSPLMYMKICIRLELEKALDRILGETTT